MDLGRKIKRYVQIADQNLGRAEKSEVLTDEVHGMEKQMELIRQAFSGVVKRLQACLPPTTDPEKRLKKLPESLLSANLLESAGLLSHGAFATVFGRLSEAEKSLAEALIHYTLNVEKNIIEPLNNIVEKDIPAVAKLRKELTKATLDMDSAKKAYLALQKQAQVPPGKVDSAREGVEAEELKVDQCRDQLVTEMYQFSAREEKLCRLLLSVIQLQADYHRRSIELLDHQISQMSEEIELNTVKPVYGCDLKEHLSYTTKDLSTIIEVCVQSIEKHGLDTEGLFRIAPSASKLRKLTAAFDANVVDVDWEDIDAHCLAGALKLYLRELPEPLMTFELYNEWSNAAQMSGNDKLEELLNVLKKLPKANYDNLKCLIQFLAKVTEHSDSNKMSASNLAIVIAPNLLYPSKADQGSVKVTGVAVMVVEPLITHARWFFSDQQFGDLNQGEENGEVNKGSAAVHALDRVHKQPLLKAKKAFAPAPPIGRIGRERSESAPEYQRGSDSVDSTAKNIETNSVEKPKSAQPYERTVPILEKPTFPPPPRPKKPLKGEQVEDPCLVENSTKTGASYSSLDVKENPLANRLVQSEALDEDTFDSKLVDGVKEDDGLSNPEVFSPLGSCSSPSADDNTSISKSVESLCDNREIAGPKPTTEPSIALLNSTAGGTDLHNVPGIKPNEAPAAIETTNKTSRRPSLKALKHVRQKSSGEATITSSSSSSALFGFERHKTSEVDKKSTTLPMEKKLAVELCRVTVRSESADSLDAKMPPRSKDISMETAKVRPKAPPRVPLKETKGAKVPDEASRNLREDTHL